MTYSRRQILRAIALGGAVVASELWIPGQRIISLPPRRVFFKPELIMTQFRLHDAEFAHFRDLWIVARQNGGALLSKGDGTWEYIKPTKLYDDGSMQITVTNEMLENIGA